MEAQRWHKLSALLEHALEHPPEARARVLDEACGSDTSLRKAAEDLLMAYPRAAEYFEDFEESLFKGPAPSAEDGLCNRTISHFLILEKLNDAPLSCVYKAYDLLLNRTVVLKFLPVCLNADPQVRQRFIQEARSAAALDHPNICTIYEIGETNGQLFIAMAYYPGKTLKEKIRREALTVKQILDLAQEVIRGLIEVHRHHIVHRDIKPANIIVTEPSPAREEKEIACSGQVKIIDFGLAKQIGIRLTKTRSMLGTVAYMSPEQVRGDDVDHRTDIWSMGAMLYELLTGVLPFEGECEAAALYRIVYEQPVPLTTQRSELPKALERIIDMCLEKEPDDRYQNIAALLQDLQHVMPLNGTVKANLPLPRSSETPGDNGTSSLLS